MKLKLSLKLITENDKMYGFCPLASGSRGNSIYLSTPKCKILIDAGLSGKATQKKLEEINVDISDIDAILVTHEHSDHIQGLKVLACRKKIPVIANAETAKAITQILGDCPQFKIFSTGETFEYADLEIHPFRINHDAMDPVAYTIKFQDLKLGFCTDLGFVTALVKNQLEGCDYLYLESNHQPSMVHACPRPATYKQRVLGRSGHLSNEACGELLRDINNPKLKHVHLAHLSQECNSPETALNVVSAFLEQAENRPEISVAPQATIAQAVHF